jgi:hypothetical protein
MQQAGQEQGDWMQQVVQGCRAELQTCEDPAQRTFLTLVIDSYEARHRHVIVVGLGARLKYIARRVLGVASPNPADMYAEFSN